MKVFVALVKRELLEHRMAVVGAPVIIGATMLVIFLLGMFFGKVSGDIDLQSAAGTETQQFVIERPMRFVPLMRFGLDHFATSSPDQQRDIMVGLSLGIAGMFAWVLFLVVLFYLAGAIYDERNDGSIFFYKSMPISDFQAVLSKLVTGLVVVPWAYIAGILVMQLIALLIMSGFSIGTAATLGSIWGSFGILTGLAHMLVLHLTYACWVLPIAAWILLVSSYVNRGPLLFAVLLPFIPSIVEGVVFGSSNFADWIGSHLAFRRAQVESVTGVFAYFGYASMYVGLAIGAAFTAAAVHFRRERNTT